MVTTALAERVQVGGLVNGVAYTITAQLSNNSGETSLVSAPSAVVTSQEGRVLLIGQHRGLQRIGEDYARLQQWFADTLGYDISDHSGMTAVASKEDVLQNRLRSFFRICSTATDPHAVFVVAYLGHGHSGSGNWIMKDCDTTGADEDDVSTISLNDVVKEWQRCQPKPSSSSSSGSSGFTLHIESAHHLVVYLDSCHSGAWVERAAADSKQMPPRVHIQSACDAATRAVDGAFTRNYLQFAESPRDAATRTAVLAELLNDSGQRPMAFNANHSPIPLLAADG